MNSRQIPSRTGIILFLAMTVAVWWALNYLEPRADWLRVESVRVATTNAPLPLRIKLSPSVQSGYLCADLHWATRRHSPQGFLAAGGIKLVPRPDGVFDFSVPVPARPGMRFVMGVIYLSPTGNWSDRTRAAITRVIPVNTNGIPVLPSVLEPLPVKPLNESPVVRPPPSAFPRILTALIFLLAAVKAVTNGRSASVYQTNGGQTKRWWWAVASAFVLASLWELFDLETMVGDQARAMARAGDFYYPRVFLQKNAISFVTAATMISLVRIWRMQPPYRAGLWFFGLYLGLAAVNLLSLHAIDQVAERSWHGLALIQALKLGCAGLTLRGICRPAEKISSSTTARASVPSRPR